MKCSLYRASKMALRLKVIAAKARDLNLACRTHVVEGENKSCMLSSDPHMCATIRAHVHACMRMHTCTHTT